MENCKIMVKGDGRDYLWIEGQTQMYWGLVLKHFFFLTHLWFLTCSNKNNFELLKTLLVLTLLEEKQLCYFECEIFYSKFFLSQGNNCYRSTISWQKLCFLKNTTFMFYRRTRSALRTCDVTCSFFMQHLPLNVTFLGNPPDLHSRVGACHRGLLLCIYILPTCSGLNFTFLRRARGCVLFTV